MFALLVAMLSPLLATSLEQASPPCHKRSRVDRNAIVLLIADRIDHELNELINTLLRAQTMSNLFKQLVANR